MAEAETIDVVLEDEKPPTEPETGAEAAKPEKKADKKPVEPEEGIETLKEQLAAANKRAQDEAAARQSAEASAQRAAQEAAKARGEKQDGDIEKVENAIGFLKAEQDSLTEKYADALASQDYGEAAKLQLKMSGNAAKLLTLENGLEGLKSAPKAEAKPAQSDPLEALTSQLTPRSASWVRAHPEYARDPRLYQRMIAAHNLAVTDGLSPESDEYFTAVERTLGIKAQDGQPAEESALSAAAQPATRRSAPPAAPVGRGGGSNPNRVTLSREQIEAAEACGMTPEQYAKNLLDLKNEGRIH